MNTKTVKAKGREFQNKIRDLYRKVGLKYGLVDGDIEGRQMGGTGVDIIFSPRALNLFPHLIECKKHRKVSVPTLFVEHFDKYKDDKKLKLLFHENDRAPALVTMRAEDFLEMFEWCMKQYHKNIVDTYSTRVI